MRAFVSALSALLSATAHCLSLFNNAAKGGLAGEGLITDTRPAGGFYSAVPPGNSSIGTSFRRSTYLIADVFSFTGARWRVKKVTAWGLQPFVHTPSITSGRLEIRRGSHVGPVVAWSEAISSDLTDIYRHMSNRPSDDFQLQKVTFTFDDVISPGNYWVVFWANGIMNMDGPWSPFLTPPDGSLTVPGANAKVRVAAWTLTWYDITDAGSFVPLDIPFWIDGEKLPITAQPGERVDPPMVVPDPVAPLMRAVAR